MSQATKFSGDEVLRMLPKLTRAVIETIQEAPDGAPASALFLAFQTHGISLDTFNRFMTVLERANLVKKEGQLFFPTKEAAKIARSIH